MPKALSLKKLILRLRVYEFTGPYSGGKHSFMIKGSLKLRMPNPHRSDISSALLAEILRQAGISSKDWDR
jgi:hypothetical protein